MTRQFRILAAYIFAIPLALILGFLAASPNEITFILIGMLLFFLALPLFIEWHHAMLIVAWNSAFNAYFLPGQPYFWLLFAAISFGLAVLNRVMGQKNFLPVPEMTRPLLCLAIVILFTAWYHGGVGLKVFGGSTHGGKYYVLELAAIVGYFAFTAGHVPVGKGGRMASLFFLSGATNILGNLVYTLGPAFYFMFYLVPAGGITGQIANDYGLSNIDRIQGLEQTSVSLVCFLLACYGLREIFRPSKPWRLLFLVASIAAGFFAGFRTIAALLFLILAFQFYLEGLFRTRLFPVVIGMAVLTLAGIFVFAPRLPLSVQRAVSFLPVNIDSAVRADATGSYEWRIQMWSAVWKEVPKYLLIGKGYSFDPTDMAMTKQAMQMGIMSDYEEALLAGDYHSGPLSVLMPFGLAGAAAVLWVLYAGFRVLLANFRHGDEALRRANTALLSFYLAQIVAFFVIFGALSSQLYIFLGVVGLSVSLNGGVKKEADAVPARARRSLPQAYAIELS
jgi:hypothetical protein